VQADKLVVAETAPMPPKKNTDDNAQSAATKRNFIFFLILLFYTPATFLILAQKQKYKQTPNALAI
jgi:hypothetical protein